MAMEYTKATYEGINYCVRCGGELYIRRDHEGRERPHCHSCGWVYYKNPVPAAACVVFDEEDRLLIILRKNEPKAGEWALPSGYIEIDQTPEETSVRELEEETGLIGRNERFLGYFTGSSPLYQSILSFGFLMKAEGGRLLAGDDAAEASFVPLSDLPPIAFASHRHFIEEAKKLKGLA